jgi:5-methylcytosine-specific restriction endonuclease McrA
MQCQLCQRELDKLTVHHLVPRQTVKRKQAEVGETIAICSACHLFTNQGLAKNLNTIDKLRSEPKMEKFLAWVKKQKPDKKIRVYRNK